MVVVSPLGLPSEGNFPRSSVILEVFSLSSVSSVGNATVLLFGGCRLFDSEVQFGLEPDKFPIRFLQRRVERRNCEFFSSAAARFD
jgi:hypothetical protein